MFKTLAAGLIAGLAMMAPAQATTVSLGFEGLPNSFIASGTFTEDGYTISATNMWTGVQDGTDGRREVERRAGTDGTMTITRPGELFSFDSVDWQLEYGSSASISIAGFLGGTLVGTDMFTTASFAYQTFTASVLAGLSLDSLTITADRNATGGSFDALVLSDVSPVPLPATGLLLIGALGGIGLMRKTRK